MFYIFRKQLANINVAVWIRHIFQLFVTAFSARIMGRKVFPSAAIKVVVESSVVKHGAVKTGSGEFGRRFRTVTSVCHVFNDQAGYASVLPFNQTSISWMTDQPVVDVALNQDLPANVFPQREVNGVVVCFAEGWCGRDIDVYFVISLPAWCWGYCVRLIREMRVVSERVTPNQSPASSISFHVTVNLECVVLRSTVRINPINTRDKRRRLTAKGLARRHC